MPRTRYVNNPFCIVILNNKYLYEYYMREILEKREYSRILKTEVFFWNEMNWNKFNESCIRALRFQIFTMMFIKKFSDELRFLHSITMRFYKLSHWNIPIEELIKWKINFFKPIKQYMFKFQSNIRFISMRN